MDREYSVEALKALQEGTKPTREHNYPRKCAARELLAVSNKLLTTEFVLKTYKERYGRFNLVTKEENRRLMKYQKADAFTTPEEAYAGAGVRLIPLQVDQSGKVTLSTRAVVEGSAV